MTCRAAASRRSASACWWRWRRRDRRCERARRSRPIQQPRGGLIGIPSSSARDRPETATAACLRRSAAGRTATRQRHEVRPIVGGVQLAAEADVPARGIAERRNAIGDRRQDAERRCVGDLGNRQVLRDSTPRCAIATATAARCRARRDRASSRSVRPQRNRSVSVAAAVGRRQHDETHAAMNREDAAAVVEADPRVDRRPIEEMPAQRRAAVIGGDAGRQDQADAAAGLVSCSARSRNS